MPLTTVRWGLRLRRRQLYERSRRALAGGGLVARKCMLADSSHIMIYVYTRGWGAELECYMNGVRNRKVRFAIREWSSILHCFLVTFVGLWGFLKCMMRCEYAHSAVSCLDEMFVWWCESCVVYHTREAQKQLRRVRALHRPTGNVYSLLAYLIYYIYMLTWCKHALCMFNVEELVSVLQNIRTLPGDHRIFNIEPIGFLIALDFKHI